MKFTKLSTKFDKLLGDRAKGKNLNPEKVSKLQQLLADKKSRYEEKLKTDLSDEKRKSFDTKLTVVNAQIEKSNHLLSNE